MPRLSDGCRDLFEFGVFLEELQGGLLEAVNWFFEQRSVNFPREMSRKNPTKPL